MPSLKVKISYKYKGLRKIKFILRKILETSRIIKPIIISNKIEYSKVIRNIQQKLGF